MISFSFYLPPREYIYRPFCKRCGIRLDINWEKRKPRYSCLDCSRKFNNERCNKQYWKGRIRQKRSHLTEEQRRELARLNFKKRYYREINAEGDFSLEEWNTKLEEYNYRCAYCGQGLSSNTITIDHVIPLSRGGSNYIDNLVPACRLCNSKKHNKTAEEYLLYLQK